MLLTDVNATPSLNVGALFDFLDESNLYSKRIYNAGTSTAFVRVELVEFKFDDNGEYEELSINSIGDNGINQDTLIVSPMRLIVSPNGFQNIRIMWPGNRDIERYFRLRFIPVIPELNNKFNLSPEEVEKYKNDMVSAGVSILNGYGSVFVVKPNNIISETMVTENETFILFENKGNSVSIVDNIKRCDLVENKCVNIGREFVFPGHTKKINKESFKVTYNMVN